MSKLVIKTPTKLVLPSEWIGSSIETELNKELRFKDLKVDFAIKKWKEHLRNPNSWFVREYGVDAVHAKIAEMETGLVRSALFKKDGELYTYSGLAHRIATSYGCQVERAFPMPEPQLVAWQKQPPPSRWYQQKSEDLLLSIGHGAVELACHRGDDGVLMFDGTTKQAKDVRMGDILMGPDSTPRNVYALHTGFDEMFKITTINGQTMVVNGEHILVLRQTCKRGSNKNQGKRRKDFRGVNPIIEISVREYLKRAQKKTFKHIWKMFSPGCIKFESRQVPIDAYSLGVLLGDGSIQKAIGITTMDQEIVDVAYSLANERGLRVRINEKKNNKAKTYFIVGTRKIKNPLAVQLQAIGLLGTSSGDKFIPYTYKVNSEEVRRDVLAGLIDTDGSYEGGCFTYTSKSKRLADDFSFIARSLGMRATVNATEKYCQTGGGGLYWRVCLSGDIDQIPTRIPHKKASKRLQKKNATSFGFSVEKISENERFYGWSITGDRRYLTDSFLVTHNTGLGKSNIICNLLYRLGLPSVVVAPTLSIANQLYKDCINYFGAANVGRFFSGKKEAKKKFTIAVSKSLTLLKPGSDDYNTLRKKLVVIGDESHLLPAATLAKVVLQMFSDAPYRFFLSGTQTRSDGMGIVLEGIIGHIVMHMDVKEGVDQGFLAKPKFVQVRLNSTAPQQKNFDPIKANRTHLHKNPLVYDHVGKLVKWAVKSGKKPLVLLEEVSQFGYLWPHIKDIPNIGFAHGGVDAKLKRFIPEKFHKSDSMTLVSSFDCGILDLLVGTQCIGVGTDIKTADVIIDVVGLASEVRLRQNVGRGTRKHNEKTDFMYVDYDIQNIPVLSKQAEKRLAIFNSIYGPVKVL